MEALVRLVETIFIDFLIGLQAAIWGFAMAAWISGDQTLVSMVHMVSEPLAQSTPLLLMAVVVVYSIGAALVRIYDVVGNGVWCFVGNLFATRAYLAGQVGRPLADDGAENGLLRLRVAVREGRIGEYLNYLRSSQRITAGIFFNSLIFTIVYAFQRGVDHDSGRDSLARTDGYLSTAGLLLPLFGLAGFCIASAAATTRSRQIQKLL